MGKATVSACGCRAVLLKSEGLCSAHAGEQTEMTAQSVNGWLKRFEAEGIKGLHTRPEQGRKPVMDCSDGDAVGKAIESGRQSVRAAGEAWRQSSGKEAGELTFGRFLSAPAQDLDV
ncbi:MAG: helix-turn-helix domain-containing protein [Dysgonamonadaceae bacterium]|jgi:transposase|nr:helix-turn-helix domain-containing protein [Dysgonamonadaceae bacterium]